VDDIRTWGLAPTTSVQPQRLAAAIVWELGSKDRRELERQSVDASRNSTAAGTYGHQ
jgi:hypothetical protein